MTDQLKNGIDLSGKVALVSGGSLGIGKASASALAAAGANVAITARDQARLDAAAEEIRAAGGGQSEVLAISADLLEQDAAKTIMAAVRERFGRLDILVNSAGQPQSGDWRTLPDEAWISSWQLKLMGAVRLTREALPLMSRGGRIVNIIGAAGIEPRSEFLPGSVTNAAFRAFNKAISRDLAPQGILVNAITPGTVAAGGTLKRLQRQVEGEGISMEEAQRKLGAQAMLVGQLVQPEEIAAMVVFLSSSHLATTTGAEVVIDGGNTYSF